MKLMKDMSSTEFCEMIAAVGLRLLAFSYALAAVHYGYHLTQYLGSRSSATFNTYTAHGYMIDILFYVTMSFVLFVLTAPLARLLCRGLLRQFARLSQTPTNDPS